MNTPDPSVNQQESSEAGLSLVELAIGTVVMVVGLVGIISSCLRMARLQKLDSEIHYAYTACRDNLEELRSLPTDYLTTLNGTGFDVPGPDGFTGVLTPVTGDPDGLPGAIEVTVDQQTVDITLYRVKTAVEWEGTSGRRDFELELLIVEDT